MEIQYFNNTSPHTYLGFLMVKQLIMTSHFPQALPYTSSHTPAAWNDNRDVISYYGLIAPGLGVDKVYTQVFLFARDRQVVVTPPCHHGGLLLLQAA